MTVTEAPPQWLDDAEAPAWRAFIDGSQRLTAVLNQELVRAWGLGIDDYRILVLLSESETGALRMNELADGIVSSRSRLSHQVRRLEGDGYVHRQECPSDGRGVLAVLTAEGRQQLAKMAPGHLAGVRRHFIDRLSGTELRVVADVFTRVDEAIKG